MSRDSLDFDRLLSEEGWTRRLAARLVGGAHAEAGDVAQDAWVALLRARPLAGPGMRAWLRKVVSNLVRERGRELSRRLAREQRVESQATSGTSSPEELAHRAEIHRLLVSLVLDLDEPIRQTVLARYFEDRSAAEIARATGTPAGTVRWRLKLGLDELRRRLGARHPAGLGAFVAIESRAPRAEATSATGGIVFGKVALVSLAVGVAVGLAAARNGRDSPPLQVSAAAPPAGQIRSESAGQLQIAERDPAKQALPVDEGLAPCRPEVLRLRRKVAQAEAEIRDRRLPHEHWVTGKPNPAAEVAARPLLEQIVIREGGRPDFDLSCRTWVCRLEVERSPNPEGNLWTAALQRDAEARGRFRRMGFGPDREGRILVHLGLADPSGSIRDPRQGPLVVVPDAPSPATIEECRHEIADLERRLLSLRAAILPLLPPDEEYPKRPPNPELTKEIDALVRRILGGDDAPADLLISCRGTVCLVRSVAVAEKNDLWRMPLRREKTFSSRIRDERATLHESYFRFRVD